MVQPYKDMRIYQQTQFKRWLSDQFQPFIGREVSLADMSEMWTEPAVSEIRAKSKEIGLTQSFRYAKTGAVYCDDNISSEKIGIVIRPLSDITGGGKPTGIIEAINIQIDRDSLAHYTI
jgi:hypothetical protein